MVCVGAFCFRVGYLFRVYKVLDFMVEEGTVIGVMGFLLVELAILVKVKVVWYWVW